jgi:acyl carrier protein
MTALLSDLLKEQFPAASFDAGDATLAIGAFPEWDSLAHFNFLMLVEESYGIRFSVDQMSELKSLAAIRGALAAEGIAA